MSKNHAGKTEQPHVEESNCSVSHTYTQTQDELKRNVKTRNHKTSIFFGLCNIF